MLITGGELIIKQLLSHNITKCWVYSGGAVMSLIDPLSYQNKIKYYIHPHEQYCGFAATAYAKSTNNLGVVICTSGPGITNLITPILDAQNDSTPLLVLSGNVPLNAKGTNAFQEAPATDITKSITKWSYDVKNINELSNVIDKSIYIANNNKKGSVHIDIPKCILSDKIIKTDINDYKEPYYPQTLGKLYQIKINNDNKYPKTLDEIKIINKNDSKYNNIVELINKSTKPIIYAGQGVNNSYKLLRKFAIKTKIPVTTTIHAMGSFPENHDLSLQFVGMHGNYCANKCIQEADLILAIGSRFDDRTTGNIKDYAPNAFKAYKKRKGGIVHVNIDKKCFNKVINTHINIETDCNDFFKKIIPKLNKIYERNDYLKDIKFKKNLYKFNYIKQKNLVTQDVIVELNNQIKNKKNYIFTTGVGNHMMIASQYLQFTEPKSFISSGSLGAMGTCLPYTIGASIGNPDKICIGIDGDGSFEMSLSDLKTINRYNLNNAKIIVVNNNKLDMVHCWENIFFNENNVATNNNDSPDYHKISEVYKIDSYFCDNKKDLTYKMNLFLNNPKSSLLHVKVEPSYCLPLVAPGKALDDVILNEDDLKKKIDKNSDAPN